MTVYTVAVFSVVYLGMLLGGLPGLRLDRTGIALLGAIALVAGGVLSLPAAEQAVDLPTLLLLFSFMVMSAQLRLAGFYDAVTRRLAGLPLAPSALLAALVLTAGLLSAVFSNDIVCLAMAPLLVDACRARGLAPLRWLLALACAANIGSGLTLIGNPQNMLIGAALHVPFGGYVLQATVPVALGLLATWAWCRRGLADAVPPPAAHAQAAEDGAEGEAAAADTGLPLDRGQAAKGLLVALAVLACFLVAPWPRELVALTGAGVLLTSRQLHARRMLGLVDWELLVLFIGLFIVNAAFAATGLPAHAVAALAAAGVPLSAPGPLALATLLLSNTVSNVPAVMLLLPVATHPLAGPLLALVSTFAGNLVLVGSIANLIVVDAAARRGVVIDWRLHARVGIPVTVLSMLAVAATLAWISR